MPLRRYKVLRFFEKDGKGPLTIKAHVTLEEAQEHCRDPETSSRTCTSAAGRRYTEKHGAWFDGYTDDR